MSKKVPDHLLVLTCVQFEKNKLAIFETFPENVFYLGSKRAVSGISEQTTEFVCTMTFDISIVSYALGFALTKFILSRKAKATKENT